MTAERFRDGARGFDVIEDRVVSPAEHPPLYKEAEAAFAAEHLRRSGVRSAVNIGSYRLFALGLSAWLNLTTVDVRGHAISGSREAALLADARSIPLPDASTPAVVTLSSIEHFGLGRYGDALDPDGDMKAMAEIARILQHGGHLILSTTITRGRRTIAFNAHRIYDHPALLALAGERFDMMVLLERFYSRTLERWCGYPEVTEEPRAWDVYCGVWRRR